MEETQKKPPAQFRPRINDPKIRSRLIQDAAALKAAYHQGDLQKKSPSINELCEDLIRKGYLYDELLIKYPWLQSKDTHHSSSTQEDKKA